MWSKFRVSKFYTLYDTFQLISDFLSFWVINLFYNKNKRIKIIIQVIQLFNLML